MFEVKFNKIEVLAQEYKLSNIQVELLKFYADPDHKYWTIPKALEELGIDTKLDMKAKVELETDIDWLFIWRFLRQADDGYPVPIYLCV